MMIKSIRDVKLSEPRKPNSREVGKFLLSHLRTVYFEDKVAMNQMSHELTGFVTMRPEIYHKSFMEKNTYQTLKGHIRRGQLEPVLRFLDNRNMNFRKELESYANTPSILTATLQAAIGSSVPYARLDPDINGGNKDNENEQ